MNKSLMLAATFFSAAYACNPVMAAESMAKVHPQQIIRFKTESYGCMSKEALEEASQYAHRHEDAEFRTMFSNKFCVALPKNVNFKILRIANIHPDFDVIEITDEKTPGAMTGLFAEWDYR
ncbi:hypothetical protein [Noviherbaspirillum autotrophicum]|jgi:hypothetical protein|nr:hypothetical protein [Noviherbaspirillum autotrophicum]